MKQLIALVVTVITVAGTALVGHAQSCGGTDYYNASVGQCVTRFGGNQEGH
jgi:hypothetical protein